MSDIIQLLPDSVANQIAAGEVIQRPASVVKELVENAIDAGSTDIKLIIKDAGKTLIQVIDNGCGMSETDARLAFERHATSKIKNAADLFNLKTKGFRGEALASIAAIAHVELKTKMRSNELGVKIEMEGSKVIYHEAEQCSNGSSFSVKNLFYNVPARRNFLKTNAVETKHIIDEFQRIALTHPEVALSFYHNETEVYNLDVGTLRQRIIGVFGKNMNQKLVPIEETTDIVTIKGFIGKPENAKKSRGEQFFFANDRFIKSNYLNHAVVASYDELIANGQHPSYFIYLEVNPEAIDINIHPTKTEVKFEEEKAMYAILRSSVRNSLGKYNIAPTIDFEQENDSVFGSGFSDPNREIVPPTIKVNPSYNPFEEEKKNFDKGSSSNTTYTAPKPKEISGWKDLMEVTTIANFKEQEITLDEDIQTSLDIDNETVFNDNETPSENSSFYQLHNKYIVSQLKSGLVLVHQQRAKERILFDQLMVSIKNQNGASQQSLFPETINLSPADITLLYGVNQDLHSTGLELEFAKDSVTVLGLPAEIKNCNSIELIDSVLHQLRIDTDEINLEPQEKLAQTLAFFGAIKMKKSLKQEEMRALVDQLFALEQPNYTPTGKKIILNVGLDELEKRFD